MTENGVPEPREEESSAEPRHAQTAKGAGVEFYRFVVDERGFCIADWQLAKKNRDFLRDIDPTYFEHIATHHAPLLEGDEKQFAALAIRHGYSHALETFFALLCSAIQAPGCPLGWMLKYRNPDLESVVRKIFHHQPVHAKLPAKTLWPDLSNAIHQFTLEDADKERRIKASFATAWARFASDFLDEHAGDEYNSIKHGLRTRPGGFYLSMGRESEYGVAPPKAEMKLVGGSAFGTSYFVSETLIEPSQTNAMVFRPVSHSRNWNPARCIAGMLLLSICINNVLSFLRGIGGEDWSKIPFVWPHDVAGFEAPWAGHGTQWMSGIDYSMTADDAPQCERSEVLSEYIPSSRERT